MKRKRNSTSKRRIDELKKGKVSHLQINYAGPSFSDLPNSILVTLLLRLSIKSIFICKCVCKAWHDLISDPHFAKLHFNQAQVCHLLRTSGFTLQSRMLYLMQPEDFDMCYDRLPIKIKLDCKLKLPLRNIQMILDQEGVESTNFMKLNMKKHKYKIVNSCNGLLCLSDPSNNEPVIVCNPITGEFINLPEVRTVHDGHKRRCLSCGFGFSPTSNQYKVIKMFFDQIGHGVDVVEVHVIGTETWRALPCLPKTMNFVQFPTYLNGCVYWVSHSPYFVISFDIEREIFESISLPKPTGMNIGVLGGELFISSRQYLDVIHVWAMKDNGANKAWSQIFSFQNDDWTYSSYKPIKYLNNGGLLMFCPHYKHDFICKDPRETGFRYLKIHGFRSGVETIAHIPSFVPLKHALSGHNVKFLKSRCAKLKLVGEEQVISIVEENRKIK